MIFVSQKKQIHTYKCIDKSFISQDQLLEKWKTSTILKIFTFAKYDDKHVYCHIMELFYLDYFFWIFDILFAQITL